jgi:transposase
MTKITRKHFCPAYRLVAAQLVVDQNYSIREAADAMNVGKSSNAMFLGEASEISP